MESLRTTNDILHGQVQSLGVQVNRLLESRAAAALGDSSAVTASSSSTATAAATGSDGGTLTCYSWEQREHTEQASYSLVNLYNETFRLSP